MNEFEMRLKQRLEMAQLQLINNHPDIALSKIRQCIKLIEGNAKGEVNKPPSNKPLLFNE